MMTRDENDLFTALLLLPCYLLFAGWGIALAFAIGLAVNIISDRAVEKYIAELTKDAP